MPTYKIQHRIDSPENWQAANPVLLDGEMGIEKTAKGVTAHKFGDGVTPWNALPYTSGAQGPQGETGPQGPQGEQGSVGPQGEPGPTGTSVPATTAVMGGIKIGYGLTAACDGRTSVVGVALDRPGVDMPTAVGMDNTVQVTLLPPTARLSGASIVTYRVSVDGAAAAEVPAVRNTAQYTLTVDKPIGSVITVAVTATDSVGNTSQPTQVSTEVVGAYVAAPRFVSPTEGQTVYATRISWELAAFEVVQGTDSHMASRYRIVGADGTLAYDSGEITAKENLTAWTAENALTQGGAYTLQAAYKGAALGWSAFGTVPVTVKVAYVRTPGIVSPADGAILSKLAFPVATSAFATSGAEDVHTSTDWKATTDDAGTDVVYQAAASTDLLSHIFPAFNVAEEAQRHIWARHNGQTLGPSSWAHITVTATPCRHGDILYNTAGKPAAVVIGSYSSNGAEPWNIRGRRVWIAVGLASQRAEFVTWCASTKDFDTTDIAAINNTTLNRESTALNYPGMNTKGVMATSTEEDMDTGVVISGTPQTSMEMTAPIPSSYVAANVCRYIHLDGDLGNMALPSLDVLMRIYQARNSIDALDPTASAYPVYKLSNWGFMERDNALMDVWTSSEEGIDTVWCVRGGDGLLEHRDKFVAYAGVIPALEIPA